jgi:hypothetical protein
LPTTELSEHEVGVVIPPNTVTVEVPSHEPSGNEFEAAEVHIIDIDDMLGDPIIETKVLKIQNRNVEACELPIDEEELLEFQSSLPAVASEAPFDEDKLPKRTSSSSSSSLFLPRSEPSGHEVDAVMHPNTVTVEVPSHEPSGHESAFFEINVDGWLGDSVSETKVEAMRNVDAVACEGPLIDYKLFELPRTPPLEGRPIFGESIGSERDRIEDLQANVTSNLSDLGAVFISDNSFEVQESPRIAAVLRCYKEGASPGKKMQESKPRRQVPVIPQGIELTIPEPAQDSLKLWAEETYKSLLNS